MKSLLLSVVALCSATAALALDPPATLPSWLAGAWEMHEAKAGLTNTGLPLAPG